MAETPADVGYREALHGLLDDMSPTQRDQMAVADARAVALFARHNGQPDPYYDIRALGDIVALIESERATVS